MNTDTRSDAELNRIIAEWMGWKLAVDPHFNGLTNAGQQHGDDSRRWKEIPDYCTDLNAVHSADEKLTDDQHRNFQWFLFASAYNAEGGYTSSEQAERMCISATARQRAEALVKVIEWGAK